MHFLCLEPRKPTKMSWNFLKIGSQISLLVAGSPAILSLTIWVYLHSFSCYCLRNTRNVVKFQENIPYSSSRSSKVIDLVSVESPLCDVLLVINCNLIATVFEILTLKDRKLLILPTPPLFDSPARGNPLEFRDETYPAKTRGMGLPYGEMVKVS